MNSNFIKITSFPKVWLPNGGVLKGFDFEVSAYNPGLFDAWNVEFPLSLQTAVPKRQAEYLAGRIAGQHALKELGISNFDIESGKHRSPTWPNGILGSITHTDNMAFCAVSKKNHCHLLGIDHENWMCDATVNQIRDMIIDRRELAILSQVFKTFSKAFTIVFSAKESLFKALYRAVGRYFDFHSVELTSFCTKSGCLTFRLKQQLAATLPEGYKLRIRFIEGLGSVQTYIFEVD